MNTQKSEVKPATEKVQHLPIDVPGIVTDHNRTQGTVYFKLDHENHERSADQGIIEPYDALLIKGEIIKVTRKGTSIVKITATRTAPE